MPIHISIINICILKLIFFIKIDLNSDEACCLKIYVIQLNLKTLKMQNLHQVNWVNVDIFNLITFKPKL